MKKFACYFLYTLLLSAIACACSDSIDIRQSYEFKVIHLPVQKKVKVGEAVEIRCQLVRSGDYKDERYSLRYFQPDGRGTLRLDDGRVLLPNDSYVLSKETFRLYYTSQSTDQQTIDLYFSDTQENEFVLSFSFNNENDESKES